MAVQAWEERCEGSRNQPATSLRRGVQSRWWAGGCCR